MTDYEIDRRYDRCTPPEWNYHLFACVGACTVFWIVAALIVTA